MTPAHTTLIGVDDLVALQSAAPEAVLVCDCRFDLGDPAAGGRAYEQGHVPGAVYVHLDTVLSGPKTGVNGRHPLPNGQAFVTAMAALGTSDSTQVVAYDDAGGMYAARLWWLLRWVGHDGVSVLDGGLQAWQAAGRPLEREAPPPRPAGRLALGDPMAATVLYPQVRDHVERADRLIVDARGADRYRGENETIDPVGGHIPGAVNRPFKDNLAADGRFKPAAQLKSEFDALTGGRAPTELIAQCGSGVTACHNLLAMEVAGLGGAALYPGSWSEWVAQPDAPVATGAAP